MTDALEKQVGGNHYKDYKIQPVEFCHANEIGFLEGSVIKYLCRYKMKDGKRDLLKAQHFLEMLIQMQYPPGPEPIIYTHRSESSTQPT